MKTDGGTQRPRPPCPVCLGQTTIWLTTVDARVYWRCPACAARFLDPAQRPERADEHAHYRLHQNDVDDPRYRRFLARLAAPLLDRLPPRSRGLDYGCGPGPALAAMFAAAGHDVVLYDPLFRPDPAPLGERFDFVVCSEVCEHFHEPADEFARLDALVRPDGWLGFMTCFQTDDERFDDWHYRRDPTHVVFYREATFAWLAHRHGWALEVPRKDVVLLRKAGAA